MVEGHQKKGVGDPRLNGLGVPMVVLFVLPSCNGCDAVVICLFWLFTFLCAESNYQL
jgi:hypothetical protein